MYIPSDTCLNLPSNWKNRASSILTNHCLVVFTKIDCKNDKGAQVFTKSEEAIFHMGLSVPDLIPNHNFYGSW